MKPQTTNRELLAAEAEGYRKGLATGRSEGAFLCIAREEEAYREGRKDEKRVQHRYDWGKLFIMGLAQLVVGVPLFMCIAYAIYFYWPLISSLIGV
jgi:hypothetical protein